MRKFIAGFCCVVVGLQVLIGVPLAVCMVFYALTQSGGGPVAFEMHSGNQFPATISPPGYPSPQPYLPGSPGNQPPILPAPPPLPATVTLTPAPSNPAAAEAAIAEVRERIPSQLTGTIFDPAAEFVEVASATDAVPATPAAAAVEPNCVELREHLLAGAAQLYAVASRLEQNEEYDRADRLRELAREIRQALRQIEHSQSQGVSLPTTAPEFSTAPPAAVEPPKTAY